jgi:hypothetical protein
VCQTSQIELLKIHTQILTQTPADLKRIAGNFRAEI